MALFEFEVVDVHGYCPVYDVKDKVVVDGARLVIDKDGALCSYALLSLKRQVMILEDNFESEGQIKCMDKCSQFRTGGFVVFACKKLKEVSV